MKPLAIVLLLMAFCLCVVAIGLRRYPKSPPAVIHTFNVCYQYPPLRSGGQANEVKCRVMQSPSHDGSRIEQEFMSWQDGPVKAQIVSIEYWGAAELVKGIADVE